MTGITKDCKNTLVTCQSPARDGKRGPETSSQGLRCISCCGPHCGGPSCLCVHPPPREMLKFFLHNTAGPLLVDGPDTGEDEDDDVEGGGGGFFVAAVGSKRAGGPGAAGGSAARPSYVDEGLDQEDEEYDNTAFLEELKAKEEVRLRMAKHACCAIRPGGLRSLQLGPLDIMCSLRTAAQPQPSSHTVTRDEPLLTAPPALPRRCHTALLRMSTTMTLSVTTARTWTAAMPAARRRATRRQQRQPRLRRTWLRRRIWTNPPSPSLRLGRSRTPPGPTRPVARRWAARAVVAGRGPRRCPKERVMGPRAGRSGADLAPRPPPHPSAWAWASSAQRYPAAYGT
jgi:hypothetical protein